MRGKKYPLNEELRIFVSDCEGPISKNDNAFELSAHFIPEGKKFFALISKYDDVLADVIKKSGYEAGNTLKLIVPFLKAYGASDEKIQKYSYENMLLVPGGGSTLRFVAEIMNSFIVSTSYEPYLRALCELTGFPLENVYSTELKIDEYRIGREEIKRLKELRKEIIAHSIIKIPNGATSLEDFSNRDQETIKGLDEIFWEEIPKMESGKFLENVKPIGGNEKAAAVMDIVEKVGGKLDNVMYIGDSITDVAPLRIVRENGGLSVSFNGNEYAIRESEIAVIAENTVITSLLADVFYRFARGGVFRLIEDWSRKQLKKYSGDSSVADQVLDLYPDKLPDVRIITPRNEEKLAEKSCNFRKKVRGEAVGKLG